MDAASKPAENVSPAASPAAKAGSTARWGLVMMVLCAAGAGLLAGILALQVAEYLFYKASPDVWPQPGSGGALSAPATLTPPVTATTAPSGAVPSNLPVAATP